MRGSLKALMRKGFNGATHSRAWKHRADLAPADWEIMLQWSHALTRVETDQTVHTFLHKEPLQWSHALTRVETDGGKNRLSPEPSLQWSHALTRVETSLIPRHYSRGKAASMEPRTHARANQGRASRSSCCAPRFNGATHSRAWKLSEFCVALGRELGFNGATHSRAWKLIFDCWHSQQDVGFNGATHSRAWKPSQRSAKRRKYHCFNGATHSRAWKRKRKNKKSCVIFSLQWSHALTRVETNIIEAIAGVRAIASMEPRTHARGNHRDRFV